MVLDQCGVRLEGGREAGDYDSVWRRSGREVRCVEAIHKNQPVRWQLAEGKRFNRVGGHIFAASFKNWLEGEFCYGSDVCKTPIFIIDGRKALFGKTRDAGFAHWEEPGRLLRFFLKALEFFNKRSRFVHNRVFAAAMPLSLLI